MDYRDRKSINKDVGRKSFFSVSVDVLIDIFIFLLGRILWNDSLFIRLY